MILAALLLAGAGRSLAMPEAGRIRLCEHWAGEEPYDAARAREIARAIRRLRCDRAGRDDKPRASPRRHTTRD